VVNLIIVAFLDEVSLIKKVITTLWMYYVVIKQMNIFFHCPANRRIVKVVCSYLGGKTVHILLFLPQGPSNIPILCYKFAWKKCGYISVLRNITFFYIYHFLVM
jgi:hypothetical protein